MSRLEQLISRLPKPAPAAPARPSPATQEPAPPAGDPDLRAQRDRLIERFTIMQADLGGAFYEMAIRDHVRLDVLTRKAADLQRVDTELGKVERAIALERVNAVGICSNCETPYGAGAAFCAQCGHPLVLTEGGA